MSLTYTNRHLFLLLCMLGLILGSCNNKKYLAWHPHPEKRCQREYDQQLVVKYKIYFQKQAYKLGDAQEYLYYDVDGVVRQKPNLKVFGMRPLLWLHNRYDTIQYKVDCPCENGVLRADTLQKKLYTNDSLYVYNRGADGSWELIKTKKNKAKFRRWMMLKVGEPPVIQDSAATKRTTKSMINLLKQKGYIEADVRDTVMIKGHKAIPYYYITTNSPILLDSVFFESKDSAIHAILQKTAASSLLKVDEKTVPLRLDKALFESEKARITQEIRNHGYEQFSWNYIYFEADTVNARKVSPDEKSPYFTEQGEVRANLYVTVLPHSDTIVEHPNFTIGNVYIIPELVQQRGKQIDYDTTFVIRGQDGKRHFVRERNEIDSSHQLVQIILRRKGAKSKKGAYSRNNTILKNEFLSDAVPIHSGEIYRYDAMRRTINQLSALDVFKFPNVEYTPAQSGNPRELDCWIRMKPAKKQVFGWDLEANTYNANVGMAVNFNYRNRNIFKGAESFTINAEAGVDFILNPDSTRVADYRENGGLIPWLNLLDINTEAALQIPRFLFFHRYAPHLQNARTNISLGYRYLQQSNDFRVSSFFGKYSYQFGLQHRKQSHLFSFSPALLNFSLEPILSERFESRLAENNLPLLKSLKEQVFIPSVDFSYTWSSPNKTRGASWYFKFYNEFAGNFWNLIDVTFLPNKPMDLLGTTYSQFYKVDVDARGSFILGRKHSLVSRIMVGVAVPYGNSTSVPFSRRFFLGGPNSMRAWRTRYLGPGRQEPTQGAAFQLGDVRLEMNLEYRFKFNSWIAGALFVDAGNIWLLRPDSSSVDFPTQLPETGLFTQNFWKEIAIGAGLGIRLDFTFFIIRFDFAMQVHNPAGYGLMSNGKQEVWNYNPFQKGRQNWVLGVGYPF